MSEPAIQKGELVEFVDDLLPLEVRNSRPVLRGRFDREFVRKNGKRWGHVTNKQGGFSAPLSTLHRVLEL